jgi:hypothetical protein
MPASLGLTPEEMRARHAAEQRVYRERVQAEAQPVREAAGAAEIPATSRRGLSPSIESATLSSLQRWACGIPWEQHVRARHPAPKPARAGMEVS